MTVAAQDPFNEYTANGLTTAFGFEFEVKVASHLVVKVDGAVVSSGDYTVTGVGVQAGGTVSFDTAPADGATVLIYRSVPLARSAAYTTNGPFPATTVNLDFDLIWMVLQALGSYRDGALRAPYPETIDELPDAATRAGGALYFDDDGNPAILEDLVADMEQASEDATAAIAAAAAAAASATGAAQSEDQAAAIVLGNFLENGTGAEAMTFPDALRGTFIDVKRFGATGDGTTDDTAAIQLALDVAGAAGKTVYFTMAGGETYLMSRVFPKSNTTIWMDGGVTLKRAVNGRSIFRLTNVNDVHIYCNGATLDGDNANTATNEPVVYFEGAVRCSLRDAVIIGPGDAPVIPSSQDCVYIGAGSTNPICEDVWLIGGDYSAAKRNGVSIVGAARTLIDGVRIHGTTGNPGAGIDVEANAYDKVYDTTIRNCYVYDNGSYGIVVSFSDRTHIHDNVIYDNGIDGIATSIAAQFNTGVYRSNVDIRGVSAFDTATGRVSLGGDIDTLAVGTLVQFSTSGAGAVPVTFQAQSRWFVAEKVAGSTTDVILSTYFDYDKKTTLSDAGAGTLNADPSMSEVNLRCFIEGQCSNIDIHHNYIYGNATKAADLGLCVNVNFNDNQVLHAGTEAAVRFDLARNAMAKGNRIKRDPAGTGASGLSFTQCSYWSSVDNEVRDFPTNGLLISGASKGLVVGDRVLNCGTTGTKPVEILNGAGLRVSDLTVYNDERLTATYGVYTDSTLTSSVFRGVNAKGAGSSNANSLVLGSNRIDACVMRDGTFYGDGSTTYDPASLADGAGVTTGSITVTGALLGDMVIASFSNNLQGIQLTGYVSATNTVVCRFQNETGGTIDLASGTLRVRVIRP